MGYPRLTPGLFLRYVGLVECSSLDDFKLRDSLRKEACEKIEVTREDPLGLFKFEFLKRLTSAINKFCDIMVVTPLDLWTGYGYHAFRKEHGTTFSGAIMGFKAYWDGLVKSPELMTEDEVLRSSVKVVSAFRVERPLFGYTLLSLYPAGACVVIEGKPWFIYPYVNVGEVDVLVKRIVDRMCDEMPEVVKCEGCVDLVLKDPKDAAGRRGLCTHCYDDVMYDVAEEARDL